MRFTLLLLLPLTLFGCSFMAGFSLRHHMIIGDYIILGFYFLTQILKDVLNFLTEDKRYVGLRYGFCDRKVLIRSESLFREKGWYLEGGPVCEERLMWDSPICTQWRKTQQT